MAEIIKDELEDLFETMRGKKIAIVGNAVFKNDYGEEIDSHDIVIRFNNYKIGGNWTPTIGEKITWWCAHPFVTNYEHHHNPSICHRHYPVHKVSGTVIRPRYDFWKEYRDKYFKTLSSGMTILYIFDKLEIDVDAYGFDHFQTGHYWDIDYKRRDFHTYENELEMKEKLTHVRWYY